MKRTGWLMIMMICAFNLAAQNQVMVQVKTFDADLVPVPNVGISLDGEQFFQTDQKGSVFIDIGEDHLPPKTVRIRNEKQEAASWNYSRGVLEIIVRPKTHKDILVQVREGNTPWRRKNVTVNLSTPVTLTTNYSGILQAAVPLDTDLSNPSLFSINGYRISNQEFNGNQGTLVIRSLAPAVAKNTEINEEKSLPEVQDPYYNLDSIRSLTEFYSVMKGIEIGKLDEEYKKRVDDKFFDLLGQITDSTGVSPETLTGQISDSTLVRNDVQVLIDQALVEERNLQEIQDEFSEKIDVINNKLSSGGKDLTDQEREQLLAELDRLEKILAANAEKFYQNQSDYQLVLNSIKGNLFDIKELEDQLSKSEQERIEAQKDFQQKLFTILLILVGVGLLTILFLFLARKFNKQKNELAEANAQIQSINERLEELIAQKTESLRKANLELDTFLYRSSHDLKRPVCNILGLSNVAKMTLDPTAQELFEKTTLVASKMDKLLHKLLMVSHTHYPSERSEINFEEQVALATKDFGEIISEKNVLLLTEIEKDIQFVSYPDLIQIILWNLLENALIFSSIRNMDQPRVELKIFQKDENIHIRVFDNGIGIKPDIQDKIWDMFYVGNELSQGSGLGLYIVRKATKALNGDITNFTEIDEFTQFDVVLPVKTKAVQQSRVELEEAIF